MFRLVAVIGGSPKRYINACTKDLGCFLLGAVDTGVKKTNTEKSPACVDFELIPEESHNEMMTKLKNQYKLDE